MSFAAGGLSLVPLSAHAMLPIIVSATVELHFGELTVDTALAGTASISTAGARSVTGGVNEIVGAGLESNAILSISGSTGVAIDVTLSNPTFTVDDGAGGGAPMVVDSFDINGGGSAVSVTLGTNPDTFPMGARLNVAAGQQNGLYIGTYSIMANYQ